MSDERLEGDLEVILDEILEQEDGLYPKETDFVEDMDRRRGRFISEKQAAWLRRINERVLR